MLMEFSESSAIQGKKYDLENIGQEIHKLYELCLQG